MGKLINQLENEFSEWVNELATQYSNNTVSDILKNCAESYALRAAIVSYFKENEIDSELARLLLMQENILEFLLYEYLKMDTVNLCLPVSELVDAIIEKQQSGTYTRLTSF